MATKLSEDEAAYERRLVDLVGSAARYALDAEQRRDEAIRFAYGEGVPVVKIARAAGLAPTMVEEIARATRQ